MRFDESKARRKLQVTDNKEATTEGRFHAWILQRNLGIG